jgi:two-component system chemotaxis response regulator CheB
MTADEKQLQAEIERLSGVPDTDRGAAPGIEATLGRIAEWAGSTCPMAATAALDLLVQIRAGGETDQSLEAGLLHLQQALRQSFDLPQSGVPPVPSQGLDDDPELVADFVVEAREHLLNAEKNLPALQKNLSLGDAVHSVFRSFHIIKGLAGFLSLQPIHEVAHETETILHHARGKRIDITPRLIDLALKAADYLRVALDALALQLPQPAMTSLAPNERLLEEIASAAAFVPSAGSDSPPLLVEAPLSLAEPEPSRGTDAKPSVRKTDATVVRVDTAKLEYLVEMTGELVVAQSRIHFSPGSDATAGGGRSRNFAHLARVTGEIQKTVLSMRRVPIAGLYDKMARLVRAAEWVPAVVISAMTGAGCQTAMDALEAGAVEVIDKPVNKAAFLDFRAVLPVKVRAAFACHRPVSRSSALASAISHARAGAAVPALRLRTPEVIAIGSSTGGTEAVEAILRQMSADSPGVIIAQHIPARFSLMFADRLKQVCRIHVKEAAHGDTVRPGLALIAPGDQHIVLQRSPGGFEVALNQGPRVGFQRPSVDLMFHSVAAVASGNSLGVILTGMGNDGAAGLLEMKRAGATTIAQDEASCAVFGMPKEAIRLGAADHILPLMGIAASLGLLHAR